MIEEDLKSFRLTTSADGARVRILSAARKARRWQVIDRWIAGGATAALILGIGVGSLAVRPSPPVTIDPLELEAIKLAEAHQVADWIPYFRRALNPDPPSLQEVTPWIP